MRITHELHSQPQTTCSVHPYVGVIHEPPQWRGARVELLIATLSTPSCPDGEVIEIEGDLEHVKKALRDALEVIELMESHERGKRADEAANAERCEVCDRFWDTRRPQEWGHANGHGETCLGDGTVRLRERPVERKVFGAWEVDTNGKSVFATLKAGDVFRCVDPITDDERDIAYTVVEDAGPSFDGYCSTMSVRAKRHDSA